MTCRTKLVARSYVVHPSESSRCVLSSARHPSSFFFFFLKDPAPPETYPLPLHDALPIFFDLRDALRGLRRDRGYTLTVVVTLALTIGPTTAVFSIVNSVLLEPLAYRESHRLVSIREV